VHRIEAGQSWWLVGRLLGQRRIVQHDGSSRAYYQYYVGGSPLAEAIGDDFRRRRRLIFLSVQLEAQSHLDVHFARDIKVYWRRPGHPLPKALAIATPAHYLIWQHCRNARRRSQLQFLMQRAFAQRLRRAQAQGFLEYHAGAFRDGWLRWNLLEEGSKHWSLGKRRWFYHEVQANASYVD
jgi:hypothetical protein